MHAADEDYAGIPHANIGCIQGPLSNQIQGPSNGGPQAVDQFLYDNDFVPSDRAFVGKSIFYEVLAPGGSTAGEYGSGDAAQQPLLNVPIGVSATWQTIFDAYVPGQSLEPPYHDVLNTDPQKLSATIAAYKAVMAGTMPRSGLPDMSDMLVQEGLADMSITPKPNLTGPQILKAMCQGCHNSHLDQTISRSHFDVEKLDQMARTEKDEAIRRVHLPKTSARHMPPYRFHELTDHDIEIVTQTLMQ